MEELRQRQKIISQLVEARLEQGISQAELARRLGIQRSGINRLESGTQNPTLDMILKIASALGKDVSLELNDKEEPMSNVYSLRIYDTELMRFSMEKQGLSGLVAEILYTNEEQAHLLPLDMERTGEGVIHWLERRVIPKNRAFVDEILKTLGLSHNDTKGIIDVCKGLSLNDSYWVVPEGFEGGFSQYNLYENRFSEILALVAYTGAGGSRQAFTTSPELTTGGMLPKAWRYQTYVLHLIDGTAIPMVEDYDLPAEKGIVGHFSKAAPDEIFTVGDRLLGFAYIPKSSIVYLETGDVIVR